MTLEILFNWPLGLDSARVSFGVPNIEDSKYHYRIGVVLDEEHGKIRYHKSNWISNGEAKKGIVFNVKRGDKVVIERKSKESQDTEARNIFDINKEWPNNAYGSNSVCRLWYF